MTDDLKSLFELLSFPSISTDPAHDADVRNCAAWLHQRFEKMGLDSKIHETPGFPVVVARSAPDPAKKTVLIYGHYDVQPVDPLDLWNSSPFEAEIREGKIWARGAADNKGQHLVHILGVEKTLAEEGELPVNVIFLIEGEEEIGSPNLVPFLNEHREELECDIIAVSDTGMVAPNTPTLGYGLRGIACLEVELQGPAGDLHSGVYGGAFANPATAAARLVTSLHDADGKIAVAGFYDEVIPLEDWERAQWKAAPGASDEDFLKISGSPSVFGEPGYSAAEMIWGRPTVEINGIGGGYQGPGSKTVIPAKAFFKVSCRLVPGQNPQDIEEKLTAHLYSHAPDGVKIKVIPGHSGKAYANDPHSNFGQAAQRALELTFGKKPVLKREGGSIPIIQDFKEILGVDSLMLGLSLPDCQIHAPNENFPVANFEAGIELNRHLLRELASA